MYCHTSLTLCATEKNGPKQRMGRQEDTGRGDPGNQLQRKRTPTPLRSQRKVKPLPRASCLRTNGVPPFHATRDSDTLPLSLPNLQSQSIITSPSLHTIKFAGRARRITCSRLREVEPKVGLMSHLLVDCWHATSLSDACPD